MIDWSQCSDVERVPDRVSGAWVIRGTRVPAQAVIDNAEDGFVAEQIAAEIYHGLLAASVRRVIEFAKAGPCRASCLIEMRPTASANS